MVDYLGDVQTAMQRYDDIGPGVAEIKIDSSDQHEGRYGVKLWNLYGRWEASEETLAESIHRCLDRAIIDQFGFDDEHWRRIVERSTARSAARSVTEGRDPGGEA
jgi:hypothetical protein